VFIFVNFSFALFTPPLGDYQEASKNHHFYRRVIEDRQWKLISIGGRLLEPALQDRLIQQEIGVRVCNANVGCQKPR
jgi:hypothetical protein